jgi:hypothetical protein
LWLSPKFKIFALLLTAWLFLLGLILLLNGYGSPLASQNTKFFFWLLLKDSRLSTRNLLKRKKMQVQSYNCELCQLATEETLNHLFLECPFARSCWNTGIGLSNRFILS